MTVDRTNGRDRRELYVDASSVKREVDGETMTDEAYRQALWQKGLEALDGYRRVEAYNHAIDPNANLMYKTHYDLGDICTVIQEKIGLVAEKRIEEVREAVEADGLAVEMTFGEDYVSLGKAIQTRGESMRSGFFNSTITGYDEQGQPIFDRAEDARFLPSYFSQFVGNGVFALPADGADGAGRGRDGGYGKGRHLFYQRLYGLAGAGPAAKRGGKLGDVCAH